MLHFCIQLVTQFQFTTGKWALTVTPLTFLLRAVPNPAKIHHCAVTQEHFLWTWTKLGHQAQCKVMVPSVYWLESIKILQNWEVEFQ